MSTLLYNVFGDTVKLFFQGTSGSISDLWVKFGFTNKPEEKPNVPNEDPKEYERVDEEEKHAKR